MWQLLKSLLPIGLIFALRSLPLDEDQMVILARSVFAVRMVGIILLAAFLAYKIYSSLSTEKVAAHEKAQVGGQSELIPEMSVQDYDKSHLLDFLKKEGMQAALMIFFHIKWNMVQPMLMSSVMAILPLLENELFRIHVRGEALARPFEDKSQAGPFAALFGNSVEDKPEDKSTEEKKKD